MADAYNELLGRLIAGEDLSREQANGLFNRIMDGELTEAQVAGALVALAAKGETVDEITGAAAAMRAHAVRIDTGGRDVIDTCGTGGTGLNTFNISTAAAFVAAGAGAVVAKHGNRTNTRPSGSADVLAALGVNIDAEMDTVTRCLAEAGVCFCFAIKHHPAMKYAVPVRKQLAVRTIFNVLGPLTNPAGAARQLMGVFDGAWVERIARTLAALGARRAMVVHAACGLDELSTTCPTLIAEAIDGQVTTRTVTPADFGLPAADFSGFAVSSPDESADRIRAVLECKEGADRDIVLLNAAAALAVAGKADTIPDAMPLAAESIDSGAAKAALDKLVEVSNAG